MQDQKTVSAGVLRRELASILQHNRDGSFRTQAARADSLFVFLRTIRETYKIPSIRNLKPKHIEHYARTMIEKGLSIGTVKNHMAHVRWLCEKIGKQGICPKSNEALGIGLRSYVTNQDKAWEPDRFREVVERIENPNLRLQLRLQEAFGMRMKEAAIFRPHENIKADHIVVDYGTKGGQVRQVPIRTEAQRELLREIQDTIKPGYSMTPANNTLKQWLAYYYSTVRSAGVAKIYGITSHGLRHGYAQRLYVELTGFRPTVSHGSKEAFYENTQKQTGLTKEQIKTIDETARKQISEELGHHRIDITSRYLGGR